ncbi:MULTISPECIES: hypothetical protein [unclassified Lactococcus]|uniref:hypothetical protein n=1 Tax=unclassified Lactococcus TaxID=2643510 RepID=UPI0011CAB605|nr:MULTISPECIES: hypothetical protein [unclassified Lactococcus]MQW23728.1 hypothetical protein [Lactococcus sp. dk101]TXK37477.1 hypothetical protein FVP42_08925 [Lactococcus sp. dk310]TXK48820.1 hypothetical protein FVP43_08900 [Lactococcus sp. dk322]
MNIIEATKKALDENKAITNDDYKESGVIIIPTTSASLGMVLMGDKPYFRKTNNGYEEKYPEPRRYWNPGSEDILREDWKLY